MTRGAPAPAPTISAPAFGGELLDWLESLREAVRGSAWEGRFEIEGVDAWDVAFNPLYLRLLALAREEPTPPTQGFSSRLRRRFRRQLSSARARLRSAAPTPARIVFWPREPTHVQVQVPVARVLVSLGQQVAFVTSAPGLFTGLRRSGFRPILPRAAWRRELVTARRRGLAQAAARGPRPALAVPAPPVPAPPERVLDVLFGELAAQLPEVAVAAATAEALCRTMRPAVLVVGNDLTLEGRTAARVANRHGVATASLMHGLLAREAMEARHVVDRYLAFGKRTVQLLEEMGMPAHRLAVTGAVHLPPPFDPEAARRQARATISRRWDLDEERPWILVATSGAGHGVSLGQHRRILAALAAAAQARPGVDFVFKLHRKDRIELYDELARRQAFANVRVISHDRGSVVPILDWVAASRAVITGGSTVALEAMASGVPVITVELEDELAAVDFLREGATLHATSVEELVAAIDTVLGGGAGLEAVSARARNLAAETFHRPAEGADRRAADEILALATASEERS